MLDSASNRITLKTIIVAVMYNLQQAIKANGIEKTLQDIDDVVKANDFITPCDKATQQATYEGMIEYGKAKPFDIL